MGSGPYPHVVGVPQDPRPRPAVMLSLPFAGRMVLCGQGNGSGSHLGVIPVGDTGTLAT